MFKNVKKLSLNKETIRALSGAEMQGVVGGRLANRTHPCTCTCKCDNAILYKQASPVRYA